MASAQSLTRSEAAFRVRAGEVGLASDEIKKLFDHGISCLAKLAFAACPPGQNPTDEQVNALFGGGLNTGSLASAKELIFEAQTLVVAELKNRVDRGDDTSTVPMAAAERDTRILEQRKRLTGLTHSGDEECSYESYNLVHAMIQQNTVLYYHPERFATRQSELQHRKPRKELSLDAKSGVVVQDKSLELKCDTQSELELTQAFRRRALAFDLAGACSYNVMNGYHHYLIQRLQETPPPGYARISTAQVLRADRAAFTRIAETLKGVRREPDGSLPLDTAIKQIVLDPSVSFHLLPLALDRTASASGAEASHPKRKFDQSRRGAKGSGKKGASDRVWKGGKGPRAPKELIGKSWSTARGKRLCWDFNLAKGCELAKPGQACPKGLHLCAEPGCQKPHSLTQHSQSS